MGCKTILTKDEITALLVHLKSTFECYSDNFDEDELGAIARKLEKMRDEVK